MPWNKETETGPWYSSDLDQDAFRDLEYNLHKCTRELVLDLDTFQSTIYLYWKKIEEMSMKI